MTKFDFTPTPSSRAALKAYEKWTKANPDRSVLGGQIYEAMRDMILHGIVEWLGNGRVKLIDDKTRVMAFNRWKALQQTTGPSALKH